LWHHAKDVPAGTHGVNYGISLSLWDYLFGTAYIPNQNPNEQLGFEDQETFPRPFYSNLPIHGTARSKATQVLQ